MTDLACLREALAADEEFDGNVSQEHYDVIRDAARAYRDLMENGEKWWWCREWLEMGAGEPCRAFKKKLQPDRHKRCGWVRIVPQETP